MKINRNSNESQDRSTSPIKQIKRTLVLKQNKQTSLESKKT